MRQTEKDNVRSYFFGETKNIGTKEYKINGNTIILKQLTVGQASEIRKKNTKDGVLNELELGLDMLILCSYTKDTNERIFDEADKETFRNMPANGVLDGILFAITEVNWTEADEAKKT